MNKLKFLTSLIAIIGISTFAFSPLDALAKKKKKKEQFRPNWMEWGSQNYPARVIRLTSEQLNSIDLKNGICYGKWCVQFPKKNSYERDYPIALYTSNASNNRYRTIVINPLICVNNVMGELPCYLQLSYNNGRYTCTVYIGKTYSEEGNIVSSFASSCFNIFLQ